MEVRPIDAVQVLHNINLHRRPTPVSEFESGFNNGLNQAMWEITHAPTLTQPNEPLTLDELRKMDGQPVWVEELNRWALVDLMYFRGDELIKVLFDDGDIEVRDVKLCNLHCYRRPPEGEEET